MKTISINLKQMNEKGKHALYGAAFNLHTAKLIMNCFSNVLHLISQIKYIVVKIYAIHSSILCRYLPYLPCCKQANTQTRSNYSATILTQYIWQMWIKTTCRDFVTSRNMLCKFFINLFHTWMYTVQNDAFHQGNLLPDATAFMW